MRKLVVGAGIGLVLVAAAPPAQAKCFSIRSVAIVGAGSSPGSHLTREQWGVVRNERSPAAVAIEGLFGRFPKDPDPPERLGPRYRLIHTLDVTDFRANGTIAAVVEQDLYPETSAGPMTFTPPQAWRSCTGRIEEIEPGWQPFPDELVDNLRSFDLPPPAGTAAAEDHAEPPWVVMAAVALAAGGTLVMARRRLSRAQAVRAT